MHNSNTCYFISIYQSFTEERESFPEDIVGKEARSHSHNVKVRDNIQTGGGWWWRCWKVGPDHPVLPEAFCGGLWSHHWGLVHPAYKYRRQALRLGWYIILLFLNSSSFFFFFFFEENHVDACIYAMSWSYFS